MSKIADAEEFDLIESTELGEWVSVGDIDERRKLWREVARGALDGKRQRISISIPERDLARVKPARRRKACPTRR